MTEIVQEIVKGRLCAHKRERGWFLSHMGNRIPLTKGDIEAFDALFSTATGAFEFESNSSGLCAEFRSGGVRIWNQSNSITIPSELCNDLAKWFAETQVSIERSDLNSGSYYNLPGGITIRSNPSGILLTAPGCEKGLGVYRAELPALLRHITQEVSRGDNYIPPGCTDPESLDNTTN